MLFLIFKNKKERETQFVIINQLFLFLRMISQL